MVSGIGESKYTRRNTPLRIQIIKKSHHPFQPINLDFEKLAISFKKDRKVVLAKKNTYTSEKSPHHSINYQEF